jgi:hypothetical protein
LTAVVEQVVVGEKHVAVAHAVDFGHHFVDRPPAQRASIEGVDRTEITGVPAPAAELYQGHRAIRLAAENRPVHGQAGQRRKRTLVNPLQPAAPSVGQDLRPDALRVSHHDGRRELARLKRPQRGVIPAHHHRHTALQEPAGNLIRAASRERLDRDRDQIGRRVERNFLQAFVAQASIDLRRREGR